MKLPRTLTLDVLQHVYELLAALPPFVSWNLPPSSEIVFHRTRRRNIRGTYNADVEKGHTKDPDKIIKHYIAVNPGLLDDMDELIQVMAHEMIHLHEHRTGMATNAMHTEAFLLIAQQVCKLYGWPVEKFVFGD